MQPKPHANKKHKPTKPGHGSDSSLKERNEMITEVNKVAGKGKVEAYDGDDDENAEQGYAHGGKVLKARGKAKGGHQGYNKGGMKRC